MTVEAAERLARAALCAVVDPKQVGSEVARRGAVAVWERLRRGGPEVAGVLAARAAATDPARLLAALERLGGRLVCPGDHEWPRQLDDLGVDQPYALWVRGAVDLDVACARSVAIVGSRAATPYGNHVAGGLAAELSDLGRTVVSGGAYGIDGTAHRGALAVDGVTVAVLACGVDVVYPSGHGTLFRRIVDSGALVSEWPVGASPRRQRFLTRNRVIAALTAGTVVVEAAVRSGARSTASEADKLGRRVMAVPGPVTSAMSTGCHVLLREVVGARLVTTGAQIVEEVGRIGELAPLPRAAPTVRDLLTPVARDVLDAVPVLRRSSVDTIALHAGRSLDEVVRELGTLLGRGVVERVGDRYRLSRAERDRISAERAARRAGPTQAMLPGTSA